MAPDVLADLRDTADALTDPRQNREPRWGWDANRNRKRLPDHVTIIPGLLQQLADIAMPGSAEPTGVRTVPASRPPLQLQAISAHAEITIASVRWCWSLRLDLRDTVESNIRQILGAAGHLDHDTQLTLLAEMRSWRYQAEVICGWRTPDPQVQAPCPLCGDRQLRINLADKAARCGSCSARWVENPVDEHTGEIGMLARHIAAHMEASKAAAEQARAEDRERRARRDGKKAAA